MRMEIHIYASERWEAGQGSLLAARCWVKIAELNLENSLQTYWKQKCFPFNWWKFKSIGKHNTWKQLKLTEEDKGDHSQQEAKLQDSFVLLFVEVQSFRKRNFGTLSSKHFVDGLFWNVDWRIWRWNRCSKLSKTKKNTRPEVDMFKPCLI